MDIYKSMPQRINYHNPDLGFEDTHKLFLKDVEPKFKTIYDNHYKFFKKIPLLLKDIYIMLKTN